MKKLILLLPIILYAQVIDTVICLPHKPEKIFYIPKGNELYINCPRENRLLVLDCSTYTIKKIIQIPADYPSWAFGVWNRRRDKIYYIFDTWPDSIAVIDNQTDSIIKWINYAAHWPPCYNSQDDKVYATNGISLAVIDCATDSIIKIIPPQTYNFSRFAMWDSIGNKVYCGSGWSDKVIVVDCSTDSIIKIISTGLGTPCDYVYNFARRKLYVGGWFGRGCTVIDAIRDTVIKYYSIWYCEEVSPVWNFIEDKVYWPGDDTLYVIDCQNDSIIKDYYYIVIKMGYASWSNRLYITSDTWVGYWQGIVKIFDCRNDSLIAYLNIGFGSIDIACNPQDQRFYIATQPDSSIYVIRDDAPGIEEKTILEAERLIPEIYPNPAGSYLTVRLSAEWRTDHKNLKIFDVSGKLVKVADEVTSEQSHKQEIRISLKGINPGIYFLKLGKETKKFLVVK
jgi:YVTN family beta-propeller protein